MSKKYIAALIFVCHSLSLSSPLNQITGGRSRCCTALFSICLRLENQLKNNISLLLFFGVDESSVNLIEKNGLLLFLRLKNCRMSFFFPSLYLIFALSFANSFTNQIGHDRKSLQQKAKVGSFFLSRFFFEPQKQLHRKITFGRNVRKIRRACSSKNIEKIKSSPCFCCKHITSLKNLIHAYFLSSLNNEGAILLG